MRDHQRRIERAEERARGLLLARAETMTDAERAGRLGELVGRAADRAEAAGGASAAAVRGHARTLAAYAAGAEDRPAVVPIAEAWRDALAAAR